MAIVMDRIGEAGGVGRHSVTRFAAQCCLVGCCPLGRCFGTPHGKIQEWWPPPEMK